MMNSGNIYKVAPFAFLLLILWTGNTILKAQTFAEVDYLFSNKLYDVLIDYEKILNNKAFSRDSLSKFYYNRDVEVYNDLAPDYPENLTNFQYLQLLDSVKGKHPEIAFYHYNLEFLKKKTGTYYDIVHVRLLREVVDNSIYKVEKLPIDSVNVIESNMLDFTMLFNKFDKNNEFKILKIEKADQSMMPDAWHRKLMPDEVKVSLGPSFSNFNLDDNNPIPINNKYGYNAAVTYHKRFAGTRNIAVSWFLGIGASYINSTWSLNYDSVDIAAVDNFGDSYTRRIISKNIDQDINMLYLKVPLGISVRLFNPHGFSMTFNGEIAPAYLLNSDYSVKNGNITYSGIYDETIGNNTYSFHLENMAGGYDFYDQEASKNQSGIDLNDFRGMVGLSIQANYRIGKYIDLFIAPAWRWGITDLVEKSTMVSEYDWQVNPLIEQDKTINYNTASIEAGLIFRINNIVKPFVKETKFKNRERSEQKENFREYLVDRIPYNVKTYDKKQLTKVDIYKVNDNHDYPNRIKYAFGPNTGIERDKLKIGRRNRVRTIKKGLFMLKPFGYDLYSTTYKPPYNAYKSVLFDSLNTSISNVDISQMADLNVSVIMKMNSGKFGIRDKIIESYKNNMRHLGEEKCALYFFEAHGVTVGQIFEESEQKHFCFSCNDPFESFDRIEKKRDDGTPPLINFLNELRILLKEDFTVERRNINLDFYIGNSNTFIEMFNNLQNINKINQFADRSWSSENDTEQTRRELELLRETMKDHPLRIDQFKNIKFYVDYDEDLIFEIKDLYYNPDKSWKDPDFMKNTYKLLYQYIDSDGNGKKSVRLRNFEFEKM